MPSPDEVEAVDICDDLRWAMDHAAARKALARRNGWNEATAVSRTRGQAFRQEVVGILGELVAARHLGIKDFTPGNGTLKSIGDVWDTSGDVLWEVKATDGEFKQLIWRDSQDMPDRRYVLVNVDIEGCSAWVRGWIVGQDAQGYDLEDTGTGKAYRRVPWSALRMEWP